MNRFLKMIGLTILSLGISGCAVSKGPTTEPIHKGGQIVITKTETKEKKQIESTTRPTTRPTTQPIVVSQPGKTVIIQKEYLPKDPPKDVYETETKTTITVIEQPDNPENPSSISVTDSAIKAVLSNSEQFAPAKPPEPPTPAEAGLGKLVIFGGLAALAAGLVAAFFNLRAGLIIGGFATVISAGAAILSQSLDMLKIILGLGVVVAAIYGAITWFKWNKDSKEKAIIEKERDQTSQAINEAKKDPELWEKLKNYLKQSQDSEIRDIITNRYNL